MWSLVLVCSIYPRAHWITGLLGGVYPEAENRFEAPVKDAQDKAQMRQALTQCVAECEAWLDRHRPSLVTHVVVTVYALEVNYDAP